MTSQPLQTPAILDPDNVAEILCDGMFNIHLSGPLAHLTLTQTRPEPGPMFAGSLIRRNYVVRARIAMSVENLVALRDALMRMALDHGSPSPATAGGTRH